MTKMREMSLKSSIVNLIEVYLITTLLMSLQTIAQYQQQYGIPQQQGGQQPIHSYQSGQQVPVQVQQGVPQQQQHQHQQQHYQQVPQQVAQYQQMPQQGSNVLHDSQRIHDKQHLKEHLHGALGSEELSKMSEEELQFHYFKMHDNDNNNKLDGSELIKSLIHWHVEESKHLGANAPASGTTKIFTDKELEEMIDPILEMDDKNRDGYIDYPEFVAAQKARGF